MTGKILAISVFKKSVWILHTHFYSLPLLLYHCFLIFPCLINKLFCKHRIWRII